ncbi:MAG: hypothetical protein RIR70_262 [Pseudomonadota bacterium]|jgi:uncharacterized protein (DUF1800 family)
MTYAPTLEERKTEHPQPDSIATQSGLPLKAVTAGVAALAGTQEALAAGDKMTEIEAVRFLAQASTGADEKNILLAKRLGPAAWLDGQFKEPPSQGCVNWLKARYEEEPEKHWDPAKTNDPFHSPRWGYACFGGMYGALTLMINAPDTVRQRVAFSLSQIFPVNVIDGAFRGWSTAAMWDIFTKHAFGNFRDLLTDVTHNYRMGEFLTFKDQDCSPQRIQVGVEPDENYAREIMQLFTIGLYQLNANGTPVTVNGKKKETYTQEDIIGLARVFSGLKTNYAGTPTHDPQRPWASYQFAINPLVMDEAKHDRREAKFLGLTIPAGTDGTTSIKRALDHLFNHANVGPFIGKQLIQRLVFSNPSPAYVARVATAFNTGRFARDGFTFGSGKRGDLMATVAAVLLDPEAAALQPAAGKLREPVLRLTQYARLLCCDTRTGQMQPRFMGHWHFHVQLYQIPFYSRSVFNFFRPEYRAPKTRVADRGWVAPEFQLVDENTVPRYIEFMMQLIHFGLYGTGNGTPNLDFINGQPKKLVPLSDIWKRWVDNVGGSGGVDLIISRANTLIAAGQLSDKTLTTIRNHVRTMPDGNQAQREARARAIVFLTMISSDYLVLK